MNKLKIAVLTEEPNYGKALARGLMEESQGLEIECVDECNREDFHVVITDMELLPEAQILFLTKEMYPGESLNRLSKFSPLEMIFQKIVELHFNNSNTEFSPLMERETKIIGVTSPFGGSGVTAIAITLGRTLACRTGGQVLYIGANERDDYRHYLGEDSGGTGKKKELLFLLEEGRKVISEKYLMKDRYGLIFFRPEDGENSLVNLRLLEKVLRAATESRRFDYILIDMGKEDGARHLCHHVMTVYSQRDMRRTLSGEEEGQVLYNFSSWEGENCIREDGDSFEEGGAFVDISMEGIFAEDIEKLAEGFL